MTIIEADAVALGRQLVDVATLAGVQRVECEVVEDGDGDGEELA